MKLKFISLIFLLGFMISLIYTPFFAIATQTTVNSSFNFTQDSELGFTEDQINFAFFIDSTALSQDNYSRLLSIWNTNFGDQSIVSSTISESILDNSRVISIAAKENNFTETEISNLKSFIDAGKGILYMTGSENLSKVAQKFVDDFFGTSLIFIEEDMLEGVGTIGEQGFSYLTSTRFVSPDIPVVDQLNKIIYPEGVAMEINQSILSDLNQTIKDIYPLVTESGRTLAIVIEFDSNGRMVLLGSNIIFVDEFLELIDNSTTLIGQSNELFARNLMKWLGRASGYFIKQDHTINYPPLSIIDKSSAIIAIANITDENNAQVNNAVVQLVLEIALSIDTSTFMALDNSNQYSGQLSTANSAVSKWLDVQITINRRGFIDQSFTIGRIFINQPDPSSAFPSSVMILLVLGGIIVFASSWLTIWMAFKKLE